MSFGSWFHAERLEEVYTCRWTCLGVHRFLDGIGVVVRVLAFVSVSCARSRVVARLNRFWSSLPSFGRPFRVGILRLFRVLALASNVSVFCACRFASRCSSSDVTYWL